MLFLISYIIKYIIFILIILNNNNIQYANSNTISDHIISKINNNIILKSDLENFKKIIEITKYNNIKKKYSEKYYFKSYIKKLILYEIFNKKKIYINKNIVNSYIINKIKKNFFNYNEYINYIKSIGIDEKTYINYFKIKIANYILLNKYIKKNKNIINIPIEYIYKKYKNISEKEIYNKYKKIDIEILKITNNSNIHNIININKINQYLNNNYIENIKKNKKIINYNKINIFNIKKEFIIKLPIFIINSIEINNIKKNSFIIINKNNIIFIIKIINLYPIDFKSNIILKNVHCFYIKDKNKKSEIIIKKLYNFIKNKNKIFNTDITNNFLNIKILNKNKNILNNNLFKNNIKKLNINNNIITPFKINNKWYLLKLKNINHINILSYFKYKIINKIINEKKIKILKDIIINNNKKLYNIEII